MGHNTEMQRLRGFGDTNFVLLARDAVASVTGPSPLPEVAFFFEAQGAEEAPWQVQRFTAAEGLSELYEVVIDLANPWLAVNPDQLLGKYAVLHAVREPVARRFYGVVRRVEHRGTVADHRLARVTVVPALWTLSQRSDARVFQDVTAVDVVEAVLREAGLYLDGVEKHLHRALPRREYCVQYQETDLDFVLRLLASEGVTFFFRHHERTETLVLCDGSHAWGALATMDGAAVPIAGPEAATMAVETVRHLAWERETKPTGVAVRDFDFTRPGFRLEGIEPRRAEGTRNLYTPSNGATLHQYQGAAYTRDDAQDQAQLRLEAERVDEAVGAGEGNVTGMIPGAMFQLSMAGAHVPPQRYVVTRVEHTGSAADVLTHDATGISYPEERYHNRFRCIPEEVAFRPARGAGRPVIAGLQTATVTGPAGEEIYTDEHGRIKVRFHWDRRATGDGRCSCWIRVMQGPWAAQGWGFQFVPRVGMEVAVSFLQGDPDRPVVVGALFNGQNPPVFGLPQEKTRSGLRTNSVGGSGFNELSFEDGAGREQVYLHAQRDHDEVIERDHTRRVGNDETIAVSGNQSQTVSGWQHEVVVGNQALQVQSNRSETVQVNRAVHVHGDQTHRVEGNESVTVNGNADRLVVQDMTTRVSGRARHEVTGQFDEAVHEDHMTRVRGHQVTIVGKYEAKRSSVLHVEGTASFYSSQTMELESEKDVLLRCGKSMIRLTPQRIELVSPEVIVRGGENRVTVGGERVKVRAKSELVLGGEKVTVKSSESALKLNGDASLMSDGKVSLKPGSVPLDSDPNDPAKVTTIELKDQDGNAIPYQRFVVVMADGSEQSGFVNHEGKATVELEEDAEVMWPELSEVEAE